MYGGIVNDVGHENFTYQVTGGDRSLDVMGNVVSATNGSIISNATPRSPHLDVNGARAVDLRIRGVSDAIVDNALKNSTNFLRQNTIRGYADRHTHVALPNQRKYYAP